MPLNCQLPLIELREAFCDIDLAPDDQVVESVMHLIEESVEFARLIAVLQNYNVRLISVDFSSYPFTETSDFFNSVSITDFQLAHDTCEDWSLPFQPNMIAELREFAFVFGVDSERPDLVVLAALRANRLFNNFLREVEHRHHSVGIRGLTEDVYRCLTVRPLDYNQSLRRRLRAPIESFAAKVYDDDDRAGIMRFEVRYDDLKLVKIIDGGKEQSLRFGWESLLKPPYDLITGVSWGGTASTKGNLAEVACLIPRMVSPVIRPESEADLLRRIASASIDDTLTFMRKFEQLKKHNLKLILVNTFRTPHEVYDEDFSQRVSTALEVLISFDAYFEKFVADQKQRLASFDEEGCRYYCEAQLEDAQFDHIEIKLNLPEDVRNELSSYAKYIPIPHDRLDLIVDGLILLCRSAKSTLYEQRMNALTESKPGYRLAIRGQQNDITSFESACASVLADFGNARVVDTEYSRASMKAWPANAPHPIDVPVYLESSRG